MPGSIIKRSATNYAVKLYQGNGKCKWYAGFQTRGEAQAFQASLASHPHHAAGLGLYGSSRERVTSFAERWLKQQEARERAGTLRPKTLRTYRDLLRLHVLPDLGWIPLAKVGPRTIEEQYARLLERGLSATTVRHVAMLLHKLFADAVRQETVAQNPCELAEPPARRHREMRVLDEEQARLFLGEAKKSSRYYVLYLAAVTTGMRQGELLGLRWQDVNLTLGTATVQRTFQRIGGQQVFGEPKTAKSRRTIALAPALLDELRRLREQSSDNGLVFCQPNGKPLHAGNVTRRDLRRVLKRAKLPSVTCHSLRHLSASLMLRQGVHPKVVQEILGHSGIQVTMDLYSHVMPGLQERAVEVLQALLFPATHLQPNPGVSEDKETVRKPA